MTMDKQHLDHDTGVASEHVTKDEVNRGRRRIAGAGIGAPILMTLASRPALGAPCLSNMLSGNLSNPDRGMCVTGWSPGAWANPGGQIYTYGTISAWTMAGFDYGSLKAGATDWTQESSYEGGSTVKGNTPFWPDSGLPEDLTMRDALKPPYSGTLIFHLIAAYLNAWLSKNDPTFQYILTPQQVVDLASGATPIPGNQDLKSFLASTWT